MDDRCGRRHAFMSWWWGATMWIPRRTLRVLDRIVGRTLCLFCGHDFEEGDRWCGYCGKGR